MLPAAAIPQKQPEVSFTNRVVLPYTKTTLIGISILGVAYATYFSPVLATISFIGYATVSGYTLSKSLDFQSAETIHKVMVIAFTLFAIGLSGTALGVTSISLNWLNTAALAFDVENILFSVTIASTLIGGSPYLKQLVDTSSNFNNPALVNQWIKVRKEHAFTKMQNLTYAIGMVFEEFSFLMSASERLPLDKMRLEVDKENLGTEEYLNKLLENMDRIANNHDFYLEETRTEFKRLLVQLDSSLKDLTLARPETKSLAPINPNSSEKPDCDVMNILTHLVDWAQCAPSLRNDFKSLFTEHFLTAFHDIFIGAARTNKTEEIKGRFTLLIDELNKLDPSQDQDSEKMESLTKELTDLEDSLRRLMGQADFCMSVINNGFCSVDYRREVSNVQLQNINSHTRVLVQAQTFYKQYSNLSFQKFLNKFDRTGKTSIKEKIIQLTSKANSEKVEIDNEDDVYNFLLMEGFFTVAELEDLTNVEMIKIPEHFKNVFEIETVNDLYKKEIFSEEELLEIMGKNHAERKNIITKRIRDYVNEKASIDVRSTIYSTLGGHLGRVTPLIQKINRKVSPIFYRLMLTFSILAPVIAYPYQSAVGFIGALAFSILREAASLISTTRIYQYCATKITAIQHSLINSRDEQEILITLRFYQTLFTGRQLLVLDQRASAMRDRFTRAGVFGKFLLTGFESGIGYIATRVDLHQLLNQHNYSGERIPVGGLLQGIVLGNELASNVKRGFIHLKQRYSAA